MSTRVRWGPSVMMPPPRGPRHAIRLGMPGKVLWQFAAYTILPRRDDDARTKRFTFERGAVDPHFVPPAHAASEPSRALSAPGVLCRPRDAQPKPDPEPSPPCGALMSKANQRPGFPDALEVLCGQAIGVRLSFWWLTCEAWSPHERFLYGCALPSRRQSSAEWLQFKEEKSFPIAGGTLRKRRVIQRSLDLPPDQARSVVQTLRAGATLADACSGANAPAIDPDLCAFRLAPDWVQLPTVYLSTIPSQSFLSPQGAGRTGLANGSGCYCARHSPPKRMAFLAGEVEPDLVLHWVAALLKRQTGVDFDRGGADAFGSFEVFAFPALDQRERPLHSMRTKLSDDGTVSSLCLTVPAFGQDTDYVAQVRAEQVLSISFDQLVQFEHSGQAELTIPEPLDGILVRIWKRQTNGPWLLWDEAEWHYLRAVGGQLNLQGLSGTVTAPWLNRLPSKLATRARALAAISQVNMTVPMSVSTRRGWESDIMAARELVRRATPPRLKRDFLTGAGARTRASSSSPSGSRRFFQATQVLYSSPTRTSTCSAWT